jgi:hypothetical protein
MEKIDLMAQSDLMLKHGFKSRNVIKGKELLDWLKQDPKI